MRRSPPASSRGDFRMTNRISARAAITAATLATVAAITGAMLYLYAPHGLAPIEVALVLLTAVLLTPIAWSFFTAGLGAVWSCRPPAAAAGSSGLDPTARVAMLVPVYNENAAEVTARVEAMRRSLAHAGLAQQFDFFLLSDSNQPASWVAEELQWSHLEASAELSPVYYRRRADNRGRKAGNIKSFCEQWGEAYKYIVTLDADSLMEGATLGELVRRMESEPSLGLLQTTPVPINQRTPWGRCQQFAAAAYGPAFAYGYQLFAQDGGNYWGHNAIIRTQAFVQHCGLPTLPGTRPLGGEILSHDFVEAALLRKSGYGVKLAADLGGSYEECPPNLPAHAIRDHRWCQGNLQHSRIAVTGSIRPMSRFHMLLGIISYCASPLWLVAIALGLAHAASVTPGGAAVAAPWVLVFGAVLFLLLAPRVAAVAGIVATGNAPLFGGGFRLIASTVVETLVSVLVAPIMMISHSFFVISTLLGHTVQWNTQVRDADRISVREAGRSHLPHMLAGLALLAAAAPLGATTLAWLSPILLGLLASVPLSLALGDAKIGDFLRKLGVWATPTETHPPQLLASYHEARHSNITCRSDLAALLDSPVNRLLHEQASAGRCLSSQPTEERLRELANRAAHDAAGLTPAETRLVLEDLTAFGSAAQARHLQQCVNLTPKRP